MKHLTLAQPPKTVALTFVVTGCKNCPQYEDDSSFSVCRTYLDKSQEDVNKKYAAACKVTKENWEAITSTCPYHNEQAALVSLQNWGG